MDSAEIYDYALTKGWILVHEGIYAHVYEKDISDHGEHSSRKYVFVALFGNNEYDGDGSKLVIPHEGHVFELDDDEDGAKVLTWWLDGNEGSEDDWFNQLSTEEQAAL